MAQQLHQPDGFKRASPESVGVDPKDIADFLEDLERSNVEMNRYMLYRFGSVISEGWWWPYRPDLSHMLHSATKSFLSCAVGLAIHEGYFGLDNLVTTFFPDRIPRDPSPYLLSMTLEDLLTQTCGHDQGQSGGEWRGIKTSWIVHFFSIPVVHKPGSYFKYSSATSFMLSATITATTGQTVRDFLEPRMLRPLDIKDFTWDVDRKALIQGAMVFPALHQTFSCWVSCICN